MGFLLHRTGCSAQGVKGKQKDVKLVLCSVGEAGAPILCLFVNGD